MRKLPAVYRTETGFGCGEFFVVSEENRAVEKNKKRGNKNVLSELWKIAVFIICSISIVFFLIAGAMLLLQGDGGGESASDNFIEDGEETEGTEGESVEYLEEDTSVSVVPVTQAVLVEQKLEG